MLLFLTHPDVLKYSGHEETFTDPLVDCKSCGLTVQSKIRFLINCKAEDLTEPRDFNLMFKTNVGPVNDGSVVLHILRPETAQQIFIRILKMLLDSTSKIFTFWNSADWKSFQK